MPTALAGHARRVRIFLPGVRYYLLALTFFAVVFAVIPFTIYAHSGEQWNFEFQPLLSVAVLGLLLFVGCALLIRLVAALHVGTAEIIAVALFCLGTFLLLAHVYAPIQIGPLDGSKLTSIEPLAYTLIEIAFLAALIVVFVQLRRRRGLAIAASFSVASVVVAAGYAVVLTLGQGDSFQAAQAETTPTSPAPAATTSDIDGNVYHIVLDRMQTDAFTLALERISQADVFAGFDLFENNISNYVSTTQSSASYFTGTYYYADDYEDWIRRWHEGHGLFGALSDRGYRIWMYSALPSWRNKYIDQFQYNVDIYQQESGFTDGDLYDLLQVWFASLAPNPLTNAALPLAAALADPVFELVAGRQKPLSGLQGLHQVASVLMLRRLMQEEGSRASDGEYVYAHAMLPHGPHVLDRDCEFVGPPGKRPERLGPTPAYLLQAECALDLVASFLMELKRLGRYDAATIVLHSDTGDWMPLGETREIRGRVLGYPQRSLLSYAQALLTIKRPYARGPLQVIDTPTELVDLYPTLVDILGLGALPAGVHGRSLYSKEAEEPREARVAFDPVKEYGPDLVEVRIDEPRNLRSSPLTVLGPSIDPANWRE